MNSSQGMAERLEQRAFIDLVRRAKAGSLIYLVIWLVIALSNSLYNEHLFLLLLNTLLFLVIGFLRFSFAYIPVTKLLKHFDGFRLGYEAAVVWQGFQYGLLTTYVFYNPELTSLRLPMLLTAAGIVGFTSTLAINKNIRRVYPVAMIVPFILYHLAQMTLESLMFAAIAVITLAYILVTTRTIYHDYWASITTSALLSAKVDEFRRLSITDGLTQLSNRMHFDDYYDVEWKRACRHQQSMAVLLIDLDHFKKINDSYGHAAGDECLRKSAQTIANRIQRAGDLAARYGGEEFIVYLAHTDLTGAEQVARKLLDDFRELDVHVDGNTIAVRCSIGVAATIPDPSQHKEQLLIQVDNALYRAKAEGRDCYVVDAQSRSDLTL